MARKLGRTSEQRMAILRNQASELLWYGRIETTVDRAKEVRRIAEKMITLAINTYEDVVEVTKKKKVKDELVDVTFKNDGTKKLNARRVMMATLRDIQELKGDKESKSAYKARTKDINHPLIEKIFNEYAPFYAGRAEAFGQRGGYTHVLRTGSRRGDNAQTAIIELVKNMPEKKTK